MGKLPREALLRLLETTETIAVSYEARGMIATDHPALAGHFPGDPIVPGALILDEVLRAAEQWRGQLRLKSVLSVKFTSPLRPGNTFSINLHDEDHAHRSSSSVGMMGYGLHPVVCWSKAAPTSPL